MSERRTSNSGRVEERTKHSTQYARRKAFHILCFTFYVLISLSQVYAQTQESSDTQLESDLPDEVLAEIIDTTRIVLEPRSRFSDPLVPQLIHAIALYPKERLWNLPPTTTPQKTVKPTASPPKNYSFHLSAYPSLPESFIYQMLFAGRTKQTHGFLRLNRQQLGNARTKERGDYNLDGIRGGFSHEYQELSEISLDLGLNLKALEWLPSISEEINQEIPNPQKNLRLFRSDLNWQHQISETTWSTLNLDTTLLRIDHNGSELRDEATDLRLNFDMALSWPFLNPIHAGGNVEYFSTGDTEEIIARLYARDEFTPFGPFVLSIGLEGVSFRESDDTGEYKADSQLDMGDTTQQSDAETGELAETPQQTDIGTGEDKADLQSNMTGTPERTEAETGADKVNLPLYPSLALTTHLDKHWLIQLEGSRTIARHHLSTLYFDTDYISLNPFLRPEKAWNAQITLKHHRGAKFEVDLSGFAKQIDDLVVFIPLKEHLEKTGVPPSETTKAELSWTPTNIEASIYGGQLLISARIVDRLDLRFRYTHEVSVPTIGEQIPYRAADRIDLEVVYHLPSEVHVGLKAELQGPRYVDMMTDETLKGYLLLQPKLSKTIGGYINAFVSGAFAIGEYRLLEMYELSQSNFDFGIELKF